MITLRSDFVSLCTYVLRRNIQRWSILLSVMCVGKHWWRMDSADEGVMQGDRMGTMKAMMKEEYESTCGKQRTGENEKGYI